MYEMQLNFDLRKAMLDYQARTGIKVTYENISQATDLSVNTIKSLATRKEYNATFQVVEKVSNFLGINPIGYFIWGRGED